MLTACFSLVSFSGQSQAVKLVINKTGIKDGFKKPVKQVYMAPVGARGPIVMLGASPKVARGHTTWTFSNPKKAAQIRGLLNSGKTLRVISANVKPNRVTPTFPAGIAQIKKSDLKGNVITAGKASGGSKGGGAKPVTLRINQTGMKIKGGKKLGKVNLAVQGSKKVIKLGAMPKEQGGKTVWTFSNPQRAAEIRRLLNAGKTLRVISAHIPVNTYTATVPAGKALIKKSDLRNGVATVNPRKGGAKGGGAKPMYINMQQQPNVKDGFGKVLNTAYLVPVGATSPIIDLGPKLKNDKRNTRWKLTDKRKQDQIIRLINSGKTLRLISGNVAKNKITANTPKGIKQVGKKEFGKNRKGENRILMPK